MQDPVKGRFYKQQLRKAPTPGVDFNFEVISTCASCYILLLTAVSTVMKKQSFF